MHVSLSGHARVLDFILVLILQVCAHRLYCTKSVLHVNPSIFSKPGTCGMQPVQKVFDLAGA